MTARRTARSALTAATLLLVLAACERPTPGVTLVSGTGHVRATANTYCWHGPQQSCTPPSGGITVLRVQDGAPVGIDVDKTLARSGWVFVDADSKRRSAVQDTHYATFPANFSSRRTPGVINLEVRSLDRVSEQARFTGVWRFALVQK